MRSVNHTRMLLLTAALMMSVAANCQNTVKQDLKALRLMSQPDISYRWSLRTGIEADSLHALLTGDYVYEDSVEHFILICYAEDVVRERRLLDKKQRAALNRVVKAYWKNRMRNAQNITDEERDEVTAIRRDWSRDETIETHRREEFFRTRAKFMNARPQVGRIEYFRPEDYTTVPRK